VAGFQSRTEGMTNMQDSMGLAVVGLAVLGSISVAVVVEWIALWGLMQMMPMPDQVAATPSASSSSDNAPDAQCEMPVMTRGKARAAAHGSMQ
jgi:hypothetical protein